MPSKAPKFPKHFPNDFWDRPASKMQGDHNEEAIFTAVGRALSKWEDVEETLAMLMSVFSESAHDVKMNTLLRQLFGTIESSASRRTAIFKVAALYFHPHENDELNAKPLNILLEEVSKASRRRDDVAHGKVTHFLSPQEDLRRGACLYPSEYNTGRNSPYMIIQEPFPLSAKRGVFRYTSSDIDEFTRRFEMLRQYVLKYIASIAKSDASVQRVQTVGKIEAP